MVKAVPYLQAHDNLPSGAARTDTVAAPGSPAQVLRALQQRAGNAAVARLVATQLAPTAAALGSMTNTQRTGPTPASGSASPSAAASPTLADQVLSPIPDVPPMSAIAAATEAQTTSSEAAGAAARTWTRRHIPFTQVLSQMAAENSAGPGAPLPAAAGVTALAGAQARYAARVGLLLAAVHYRRSHQLLDVAEQARPGGPIRAALAGECHPLEVVMDPTGDRMRAAVFDATLAAAALRPRGALVELVVHFAGHGSVYGMSGVDEQTVGYGEVVSWQQIARDVGVHLFLIADTCNAGGAVIAATADHLDLERRRVRGMTAGPARDRLRLTGHRLVDLAILREDLGERVGYVHNLEFPGHRPLGPYREAFRRAFETCAELVVFAGEPDPMLPGLGALQPRLLDLADALEPGRTSPTRPVVREARRRAAPILDRLTDIEQAALVRFDAQIDEATAPAATAPTATAPAASAPPATGR